MSQIKVEYVTLSGSTSKAYVDEEPHVDGLHHGTNKHSDEPVALRWNGEQWIDEEDQAIKDIWWAQEMRRY
jgi:hypothetical protein